MSIKLEIGTRILEARKKNRISAVELSNITGFSKSRISNWENGRRTPSLEDAKILEDALGVPASFLLCMDLDESLARKLKLLAKDLFYKIPLYSISDLSNEETQPSKWLPIPSNLESLISDNSVAISLIDESMAPIFKINDIVIIEKESKPNHGDYVVLKIHNNQVLFRKIYFDNSSLENPKINFYPLNENWPLITSTNPEQFQILGTHKQKLTIFF
ncbi:TPA: helix-turn-helix domain-containing protein [Legionella pneumophila]